MPKFDFDGPNRRINGRNDAVVGGVFSATVEELYSEWKAWVHGGTGAPFLPAFRVLGGDAIGGGLAVGTYLFLRTDLNWRITVPAIEGLVAEFIGNVYPQVPGDPLLELNAGITTILQLRNSNLTVQAASAGASSGDTKEDIYTYFTASGRQNTFRADVAALATGAQLTVVNEGVKKASLLVPHTADV